MTQNAKIGVVFSSGFFGFFAHAGFLSALRELPIEPAGFAGASSGAIVAAMAAAGMADPAIREILFALKKSDFWDPDPFPVILRQSLAWFKGYTGYLRGDGFARLLERIPKRRIEDCQIPLLISATNLSLQREELFIRGNLAKAIQASGAVPVLFKPVEIDGTFFVDGGMVNKAPVLALANLIRPRKIIVHFIASERLKGDRTDFIRRRFTPWYIHHLSVSISRQEAYRRQCHMARESGIEIIEVITDAPSVGPNTLHRGPLAYGMAREAARVLLRRAGFVPT